MPISSNLVVKLAQVTEPSDHPDASGTASDDSRTSNEAVYQFSAAHV